MPVDLRDQEIARAQDTNPGNDGSGYDEPAAATGERVETCELEDRLQRRVHQGMFAEETTEGGLRHHTLLGAHKLAQNRALFLFAVASVSMVDQVEFLPTVEIAQIRCPAPHRVRVPIPVWC